MRSSKKGLRCARKGKRLAGEIAVEEGELEGVNGLV